MDELDLLVQAVRKSPKYRNVCLDVVRNVGTRELTGQRNSRKERGTEYRWRDAVKATKNKLHQVGGAYLDGADYAGWLDQLRNAARAGNEPRHSAESAERSPAKDAGCSSDSGERGTEYQPRYSAESAERSPAKDAGRLASAGRGERPERGCSSDSGERGTEYRSELRRICWEAMKHHSSTRERLPILDQFYTRVLAGLPPPQVVLDIACGLNPLAISWMPFAPGVEYYAYDMYDDLATFLNAFMGIAGVQGQAEACDVSACPPTRRADLALILKTLPCVEQLDKLAGARLLEAIRANHLLVSFPVRSLGGRDKRMLQNYEAHFQELLLGKPWSVQRFEFSSELAFLIRK